MTYASEKNNGHKQGNHIGLELIHFITLDLTEFEREIKKASAETTLAYDDMRNLIYDLAEFFKGKYDIAHFFIIGRLNSIFFEETLAEKQFQLCFNELFSILELHKTFSFGVHLCLDIENLPQYTMPEKFVGFVTKYKKYNDFALKTGVK